MMKARRLRRCFRATVLLALLLFPYLSRTAPVPEDFPKFIVPGHEKEMESLRNLYWLHYQPAGPLIPLWDEWMPMSTLWPAVEPSHMRSRWAAALSGRPMNAEGYILTQQHDGPAHAEGWPFPLWTQAGGIGWHFRGTGVPGYDAPAATPDNWLLAGGTNGGINEKGWVIILTNAGATAATPGFGIATAAAPWLRLNWWADGLQGANCYVEWTTKADPEFAPERRAYFAPASAEGQGHSALPMGPSRAVELSKTIGETRTMIPVYRIPSWKGTITGLRLHFDNVGPSSVVIKSFHTACDTRQTVNNMNFIRGCHDYFLWTGDLAFLRQQIGRMRTALRFVMNEFDTRRRKCIYTTWPGHEGRSGVRIGADGKKTIVPGQGIGGNYWDILPFGGEDALATVYYYDAVRDLAELEEAIEHHPQWCIARGAEAFTPEELRHHAAEVRDYGTTRFWNPKTQRFGTVDLDGVMHDYGFTFLNNEAIYYGFASAEQARAIRDWISGRRTVEGDTATGADIYHWRFGPRSTTRRNLDYYFWGWSNPESIPWGYQVQDGGAVLGFSYHDLMARLKVEGADSTWGRLKEILTWFDETQAAGGYREYYKEPSRGSMQGGNVAGGLGLDKEFFESILVPQVMIYGFMGLHPAVDGLRLEPHLPAAWPELTITRIQCHQHIVDITVRDKRVIVRDESATRGDPLKVAVPEDWTLTRGAAN
jgi:Glycosyl hydrolase family 65, C-terminal domain